MSTATNIDYFNQLTKKPSINFNKFIQVEYLFVLFFMTLVIFFDLHKRIHYHIKCSNNFASFQFSYAIITNKLHIFFRRQFESLPDEKIIRVQLLFQDLLIIANPQCIRQVCNKRPGQFARIEGIEGALSDCGGNVFSGEGNQWTHHRKVTASQFNAFKISKMDKSINLIVDRFVKRIENHSHEKPEQEINMVKEFSLFSLDVLFRVGFGYDLNGVGSGPVGSRPKILKRLECVLPNITKRCMSPLHYWKYCTTYTESKFQKFLSLVRDFKNHFIKQDYACTEDAGLLHSLMVQKNQGLISDNEIIANILVYIIAGHDTTSKALSYSIWHLAQHPEIQQKVRKEVNEILSTTEGSFISNKDVDKFKYLTQCILESFRLKPLVPFVFLKCIEDNFIDDIEIYSGTQMIICLEACYRNPKYFPDPEEYKPDRWEGVTLESCTEHNLFPFGYGPRMCPGRKMVKAEMIILFAKLISNFDFKVAPSSIEISDEHIFVLSPEKGINIHLSKI